MPRALWKGSIAFGLVNIPVELHTAVRDFRPRFRMFQAGGHERITRPSPKDVRTPELQMARALVENLADVGRSKKTAGRGRTKRHAA